MSAATWLCKAAWLQPGMVVDSLTHDGGAYFVLNVEPPAKGSVALVVRKVGTGLDQTFTLSVGELVRVQS